MTASAEFEAETTHMLAAAERLDALDKHHAALATEYENVEQAALRAHAHGLAAPDELARLKEIARLLGLNEEEALAIVDGVLPLLVKVSDSYHV